MRNGGRGPPWWLIVLGLVLLGAGLAYGYIALAVVGVLAAAVGAGPLISRWRSDRRVQQFVDRGRLTPEMAGLAYTAVTGSASAALEARTSLGTLVTGDPSTAAKAQKLCMKHAADEAGTADAWRAAAREIEEALRQVGAP